MSAIQSGAAEERQLQQPPSTLLPPTQSSQTQSFAMAAPKATPQKMTAKLHRRSRSGCFTCRLRRKKCDEAKPRCKACRHLGLQCEYKRPTWWSNNNQRQAKKDEIKEIIKRTKSKDSHVAAMASKAATTTTTPPRLSYAVQPLSDTMSDSQILASSTVNSPPNLEYDVNGVSLDSYANSWTPSIHTPQFGSHIYNTSCATPYEVDIKTERETFVNDVSTRRDSSISTFSTFQPPPPPGSVPSFPEDGWLADELFTVPDLFNISGDQDYELSTDFANAQTIPQQNLTREAIIDVDDADRFLLSHFIDNVLRLIFPVLEANQAGSVRSEVVLPALESSKCYLHCCLSIAGTHLKSLSPGDCQFDNAIMRHRYSTISELYTALSADEDHESVLSTTLAMIYFPCSVGKPDDLLPDIPWHQHFRAAVDLLNRLDFQSSVLSPTTPHTRPHFNTTLAAWIDILGSTMLGTRPQFAQTYLLAHINSLSTGFADLMGCDDHIMYMISEIACLEALIQDRNASSPSSASDVNNLEICNSIVFLGNKLQEIQSSPCTCVGSSYSETGVLRPRQLCRNISALFLFAARLYLCSLVPGFDRTKSEHTSLVSKIAEVLSFIPSGPDGFDRCVVWPLLIGGSFSVPGSSFRRVFEERRQNMGESIADMGSFGRMTRVVEEVWKQGDALLEANFKEDITPKGEENTSFNYINNPDDANTNVITPPIDPAVLIDNQNDVSIDGIDPALVPSSSSSSSSSPPMLPPAAIVGIPKRDPSKDVHWRDVMKQNGWDFLLI